MGLIKPPNIFTFFVATVLVIVAVLAKVGVSIPVVGDHGYWLLLTANVLFILGCLTRGF